MNSSLQVAGNLRRGTPQRIGAKTTLDAAPAPAFPGPGRNAEPTHGNASPGKLCDSSERRHRTSVGRLTRRFVGIENLPSGPRNGLCIPESEPLHEIELQPLGKSGDGA
jgi:hypothetical protein